MRFLGLGAAIVRREELPRSAPRALDDEQRRLLLQAAEESTPRDRAIVALLLVTGLRLAEEPSNAVGRRIAVVATGTAARWLRKGEQPAI